MIHTQKTKTVITLVMLVALLGGLFITTVWAEGEPAIRTDKPEYFPEEIVMIAGTGFAPGESYAIPIVRPDSTIVYGDGSFTPGWDIVTTDVSGEFTYSYQLDGVSGVYTVYVYPSIWTGDLSETPISSTTFYDPPHGANLAISDLTSIAHWTRTYSWTIDKSVDPEELTLAPGGTDNVDYTVTLSNTHEDHSWIDGSFTVTNVGDEATQNLVITVSVTINGWGGSPIDVTPVIVDLGSDTSIAVDGSASYDYTIEVPVYQTAGVNYQVKISASVDNPKSSNPTNSQNPMPDPFTAGPTLIDEIVTVEDSIEGSLGTVSYTDDNPYEFKYSSTIGPYSDPGQYTVDNTVTYTTNDTGTTDDADARVTVYVEGSTFCAVTSRGYQELPNDQFKLIFTPDMPANPGYSRLTASNPGQFSFNVFYVADEGDEEFTLAIPYPFVTQGAVPVHIYDSSPSGFAPTGSVVNSEFTIDGAPVTLESYTGTFGDTATVTITNDGYTGPVYITVHLDYGLKKVAGGYSKDLDGNAYGSVSGSPDVDNGYEYEFAVTEPFTCDASVFNLNTFKHDPGIGGLVLDDFGDPLVNVKVEIYQGKKLFDIVYTDEDGWYMCNFKYTGKPTTFTIKSSGFTDQSVTLRANGFLVVNFGV